MPTMPAQAPNASLQGATNALLDGRLDESVTSLRTFLQGHPNDGSAQLLLCRAFYAEEDANDAIPACEAAARLLPHSSDAQDWLGRVYGLRASHAGAIAGFRLARQVRTAFEQAVSLDPRNPAAVNDLSEYYVGAPSIVGGGLEKAEALANRSQAALPMSAHRTRGLVAEKRKDFVTAEREFRMAAPATMQDSASRQATAAAQADLGAFYGRQQHFDQAQAMLSAAIATAGNEATAVDAASSLVEIHRAPELAERTFAAYLRNGNKSDGEPAPRVHLLAGNLLAARGDRAGAKIEFQKALALASGYEAAKQAFQTLK